MPSESPLRSIYGNANVSLSLFFDVMLPVNFGDFEAEYRQARSTVTLLDTNFRAVFRLSGPDRARFLNAITTNDVLSLTEGLGHQSLLLNPQGHILAEFEVLALEDSILILSHTSVREKTLATLDRFIIMDDVTLTDETDNWGMLAIEGPAAPELIEKWCGVNLNIMTPYSHREVSLETTAARMVRVSRLGETGAEFLVQRDAISSVWGLLANTAKRLDGGPIGMHSWNSLRIEAGIPWFGYDFNERVIPHEAGLENSHVSFAKGCYTGQEIVERVRSRGQVNRRRSGLAFSSEVPPSPGTRLFANGKEIGVVTSAGFSQASGTAIGFGYVRKEYAATGSAFQCGESDLSATVIELPLASTLKS